MPRDGQDGHPARPLETLERQRPRSPRRSAPRRSARCRTSGERITFTRRAPPAAARGPRSRRRRRAPRPARRRRWRRARGRRAARARRRARVADVGDLERDLGVAVAQPDRGARARPAPASAPRERLLDHAIGGQVDARAGAPRARPRRRARPAARRRATRATRSRDVRERRLRRERQLLVLAAQHAEQPADLGERLAPGVLDRGERALGAVGLRAREPLGGAGLADHRGQRVADQVVQFARDPRALVGDRAGRARLALVLGGRRLVGSAWLSFTRARTSRPTSSGPPTRIVPKKRKSQSRRADRRGGPGSSRRRAAPCRPRTAGRRRWRRSSR